MVFGIDWCGMFESENAAPLFRRHAVVLLARCDRHGGKVGFL
jgi:hypothetical protein